jgi:preprotein translocase subunit SecF
MSMIDKILDSYKPLIIIPVIITIIALAIVATGGLQEGIDLKGGSVAILQLEHPTSNDQISAMVQQATGLQAEFITVTTTGTNQSTVEIAGNAADVVALSNALSGTATIQSFRSVGPLLSKQSLTQVYYALAFAFIFMSITVFIIFRNFVPSMAVILAAFCDIIIAVGGMSIFGIPLSLASVGALLMLIGYSVDTDILLTTRVLKRREGTINERAKDAMKTGFTMAAAAIGSMMALYLAVRFLMPYAQVLDQIAAVLIIGLVADVLATWLMNLGILRWYMEGHR